jgi:hypothetical protein
MLAILAFAPLSCAEDDKDKACPDEGYSVSGISGIVLSPNCSYPVSDAEVTALHGSGVTLRTNTSSDGSFSFSMAEIPEQGRWQLSVVKGPFRSENRLVTLADGKSSYLLFRVGD